MNAKPADRSTRSTAFAVRFVLWLFAVVSLADFAPAIAESSRFAKPGLVKGEPISSIDGVRLPADACAFVNVDDEISTEPGLSGSDPALDTDDASSADRLFPRDRTAAPAGIVAAQRPDGQPFAAFNSRAPPTVG